MAPEAQEDARSRVTGMSFPGLAAIAAIASGCLVLGGWAFQLSWLTNIGPGSSTMVPNAAVGIFLLGLALWLLAVTPGSPVARWLGLAAAAISAVLGFLTAMEYLLGWELGIDRLLFPQSAPTSTTPYVGRMGINTAFALTLLGMALLTLGSGVLRLITQTCAVLGGTIALTTLVGYLYDVEPLTRVTVAATQMAFHTALLLLLLSIAILRVVPGGWLPRVITSEGPGSLASRRLLPLICAALLGLGWLGLEGQQAGLYGAEFGLSIMVLASIAVIAVAILGSAATVDRLDAERRKEVESRLVAEVRFAAMQEADRLKSRFLADMSHELRTPMNAIIGFTELLQDGKVGPASPKFQEYLSDILTSARYLLQLINDLLDLAKVESGKLEFFPEPLSLAQVAEELRNVLQPLCIKKRIHIETDIAPAVDRLILDAGKLKQVVYNLLSNALKFTPPEGRVMLRARPEGADFFRLEVEDTGIGIREEDLPRLFQEFQQVHGQGATTETGTGLGLALTKRIVEAQGGRVGVTSSPGQGSVFFALLPRHAKAA